MSVHPTSVDLPVPQRGDGPRRVMFLTTNMPVGGAETLLVNLVRGLDRKNFLPEIACLKDRGPLGEMLAAEMPVHCHLIAGKYDLRVLPKLTRLLRARHIDAVVVVGAGDKMFWGRLAAFAAGVPVVACALHSTGWPDTIGHLNRFLTPLTDAFIGVAQAHGDHLIHTEGFSKDKVVVIPNGVDTDRFSPSIAESEVRRELGLAPTTPVAGIIAALRPEKNHALFLRIAERVVAEIPEAAFLIVGDGPCRDELVRLQHQLGLSDHVRFLGTRHDIPQVLSAMDVFVLTSHNEANPVCVLEALSCGVPVVAADVGSLRETVEHGASGWLVPPSELTNFVRRVVDLLSDPLEARGMGQTGREIVQERWSLASMVSGYESLLTRLLSKKLGLSDTGYRPADSCDTMHHETDDSSQAALIGAADDITDA